MRRLALAPIVCATVAAALAVVPSGAAANAYGPRLFLSSGAPEILADLDGDRLADRTFLEDASDGAEGLTAMLVSRQAADGEFAEKAPVALIRQPLEPQCRDRHCVVVADVAVDADGGDVRPEILLVSAAGTRVTVLRQGPAFIFPEDQRLERIVPGTTGPSSLLSSASGDVNRDGRADAVLLIRVVRPGQPIADAVAVVARGSAGTPLVRVSRPLPAGAGDAGMRLRDADGDGALDVVTGGGGALGYVTALGPRAWEWQRLRDIEVPDVRTFNVAELNGDGALDAIVVAGEFGDPMRRFALLMSTGAAFATRELPVWPAGVPCGVGVGDLDGDRDDDVVVGGCATGQASGSAVAFLGDRRGGLTPDATFGPIGFAAVADMVDLNGDGLGDVRFTGGSDSNTVIYMNKGSLPPPPPPPPLPPPPPPGGDTEAPRITLTRANGRWKPGRPFVYTVKCNEPCTATITPTVAFGRPRRGPRIAPIAVTPLQLRLAAGRAKAAQIKLHPGNLVRVRAGLRRGAAGSLTVAVRAEDRSSNASTMNIEVALQPAKRARGRRS